MEGFSTERRFSAIRESNKQLPSEDVNMPITAKKKTNGTRSLTGAKRSGRMVKAPDAISLLKEDHREVEDLFDKFEKARGSARKAAIARKICNALSAHAAI